MDLGDECQSVLNMVEYLASEHVRLLQAPRWVCSSIIPFTSSCLYIHSHLSHYHMMEILGGKGKNILEQTKDRIRVYLREAFRALTMA